MKLSKILLSTIMLFLLLPFCGAINNALAANEPVTITSKAVVEIEEKNAQGEVILKRVPATKVLPGTIIIFVNAIINNGDVPVENIVINNAVPESMTFQEGSATGMSSTVIYSIDDGATFNHADKLFVPLADGSLRPAKAEDYTNIRWTLTQPLAPEAAGEVEFHARLK